MEWRDVPGTGGWYQINDKGDVYSYKTNRFLKLQYNFKGYALCPISTKGKKKTIIVARQVGKFFVSGYFIGAEINHKNGIKKDNRAKNLEWVTPSQNMLHAYRTGLKNCKGEKNINALLNGSIIKLIRKEYKKNPRIRLKFFAGQYGVTEQLIWQIKNRKAWKHIK